MLDKRAMSRGGSRRSLSQTLFTLLAQRQQAQTVQVAGEALAAVADWLQEFASGQAARLDSFRERGEDLAFTGRQLGASERIRSPQPAVVIVVEGMVILGIALDD